jgi:hypothetical protein
MVVRKWKGARIGGAIAGALYTLFLFAVALLK